MNSTGIVSKGRDMAATMIKRHGAWTRKLSMAVFDQALFAGSNFIMNVLLARWLFPEAYGAFVVAYSWFLLTQNIYDATVVEPMSVYGAGKHSNRLHNYLGYVFKAQIWVALAAVAVLLVGGFSTYAGGSQLVGSALIGAGLVSPLLLARWLTRQPFYILAQPQYAVLSGILYLIFMMVGLGALVLVPQTQLLPLDINLIPYLSRGEIWIYAGSLLTPFSAMIVMGIASILTAIILSVYFIKPDYSTRDSALNMRMVMQDHIKYGRWASIDRILGWVPSNIYYIVLPLIAGLAVSGGLRALSNLVVPIFMVMSSMFSVIFPYFVRTHTRGGFGALAKAMRNVMMLLLMMNITYCLIITLFGFQIANFLFDGKYDNLATIPILFTLTLGPVITAVSGTLDAGMRAMGLVKNSFLAKLLPTILTMTVGLLLTREFGILGANIGFIINGLVNTGLLIFIMIRVRNEAAAKAGEGDAPLSH